MKWTWEKAKLVLSTIAIVIALAGIVGGAWASLNASLERRMDRQDRRMDRLISVVVIEAKLRMYTPDSPEYTIELSKLRAMLSVMGDLP